MIYERFIGDAKTSAMGDHIIPSLLQDRTPLVCGEVHDLAHGNNPVLERGSDPDMGTFGRITPLGY